MAKITSQPTILRVTPPPVPGTWEGGQGSLYRGNQTFTALTQTVNSISSSGGWAQLPNTTLQSAYPTASQIDDSQPPGAGRLVRGIEWPYQITGGGWGTAAWNGFGFFMGGAGAHYAYWGNDMYLLRVADPVGVFRMHKAAPIQSMLARRDLTLSGVNYPTGSLINPNHWPLIGAIEDVSPFPEWGPYATHQYDGMIWDAQHELLILGGDNLVSVTNPSAYGQGANLTKEICIFDPFQTSPRTAWTRIGYSDGTPVNTTGIYALVDNSDGTFSFRARSAVGTIDLSSKKVSMNVTPGAGPVVERYTFWRPCVRDSKSNKYYEIQRRDKGQPYLSGDYTHSVFECSSGSLAKVADLPLTYRGNMDADRNCSGVIVDGVLYLWASEASVIRVNLSTGEVATFTDTTSLVQSTNGYTGTNGRWAYVPQARCFVGMSSETTNLYVFRPPQSWGL